MLKVWFGYLDILVGIDSIMQARTKVLSGGPGSLAYDIT